MLTRWANVSDGVQTVRFKYMKKKDLEKYLAPTRQRHGALTGRQDLDDREKYERYKLGKVVSLKDDNVTELIYNKAILAGLYEAFLRAKLAVERAEQAFSSVKFSGMFGKSPSDPILAKVVKEYFCGAGESKMNAIHSAFQKTSQGLRGNITISDCMGREIGPYGGKAEGIVPLSADATIAQTKELKKLDALYDQKVKALSEQKLKPKKYQKMVQKLRYADKTIDEMLLTSKYLEMGDTGSIHIEFSYCNEKSVDSMARIIAHEATHKFAATADYGYASSNTIRKLKPEHALQNADSYAFAAMSVLRKQLVTPEILDGEKEVLQDTELERLADVHVRWRKKRGY